MGYRGAEERDALALLLGRLGASVGSYIPDRAWVVAADAAAAQTASAQPGIVVVSDGEGCVCVYEEGRKQGPMWHEWSALSWDW